MYLIVKHDSSSKEKSMFLLSLLCLLFFVLVITTDIRYLKKKKFSILTKCLHNKYFCRNCNALFDKWLNNFDNFDFIITSSS